MTILVDAAIWPWRDLRWAHLVSDESYDELHEFAVSIGKRRVGFQGDHYDVETSERDAAIAAGAVAVDSRVLVRRIKAAQLRLAPGNKPEPWQWVTKRHRVDRLVDLDAALSGFRSQAPDPAPVASLLGALRGAGRLDVSVLHRSRELAIVCGVQATSERQHADADELRRDVVALVSGYELPTDHGRFVSGAGDIVVELLIARGP